MSEAASTTDHDVIRKWVEARGGTPARVRDTGEGGVLRIDFEPKDESLEPINWEDFFSIFEQRDLAFLHQDMTEDGQTSRFNKFVDRSDG
ncbi:hypothetical protein OB2597_19271 [Pseudooceanicola batsensis HTCC2597]|uniref:1,4-alpha-glucan branching enzyme n=1 Tax=Pseudooceanicola batsensis (strain ATCC BAA-863 / DSM 15984 / KCTC 12145 / HTCC2597) TaxID=252305 RepID=A3U0G4_PSEBH|nr:hypothetical protein [Pseudooceanicola batsensis]EAQ02255.1 hypothetical protein OB2597_19271 [Pseudooceanicola batsensis HTCC2597]